MVKLRTLLETIETTPVNIGFLKGRVGKTVSVLAYEQLKGQHRSTLFKGKTAVGDRKFLDASAEPERIKSSAQLAVRRLT